MSALPVPAAEAARERSPVRRNVVANYAGSAWTAIVSLVFVPLYIRYLGAEAYGLVGVFITIQALIVLLDMGLSAIANRELARRSAGNAIAEMRDLMRTLELVFWIAGVVIAAAIVTAAPLVARYWLENESLSVATVETSIALIGLAIGAQWPSFVYTGAFMGLQRHVTLNSTLAAAATVRALGALAVLVFVSQTIVAFFLWYAVTSLAQTAVMRMLVWRALPPSTRPDRVRWQLLHEQRRFAAGITGAYALTVVLTQLDKVVLSRLLTLRSFGYYALASVVATTLYRVAGPVVQAVYPRLTQLAASPHSRLELVQLYHRSCQSVAVLMIPAAVVVALFSHELLLLWTRDPVTTAETYRILRLLALGTALYGLAAVPHALQLAFGWTRLAIVTNALAVAVLLPAMLLGVLWFGAVGAAGAWLAMSAVFLVVHVHFTHSRVLPGERGRWYRDDLLAPLVVSVLVGSAARLLVSPRYPPMAQLAGVIVAGIVTIFACALATPATRGLAARLVRLRIPA
ncbi:MAG TPA: oligosaccharide flippase family protein [Gemmatimonadaceae bacterium]